MEYKEYLKLAMHLKRLEKYIVNDDRFDWHGDISTFIDEYLDMVFGDL